MRSFKLFVMFALLIFPTFALNTNWEKVKDEGLMSYVTLEPFKDLDGSTIFKVTLNPEFKENYELYFLGLTTKTTFDSWLVEKASTINIPAYLKSGNSLASKNYLLSDILAKGYIRVETPDETINYVFHIGWSSEEWHLLYNTNVTIGICDSGSWSQYSDCMPSSNWTVQDKTIYANITSNETFWKLNGTIPDYNVVQIWTDIHLDSYNTTVLVDNKEVEINVTSGKLTTLLMGEADVLVFSDDFEDDDVSDWTQVGDGWTVISGVLTHSDTDPDFIYAPYNLTAGTSYIVKFNFTIGTVGAWKGGLMWYDGDQSGDNAYLNQHDDAGSQHYFNERVDGSFSGSVNSEGFDYITSHTYLNKLFIYGNGTVYSQTFFENGTLAYENDYTDLTLFGGFVGFYTNANKEVEDVEIWTLATPSNNLPYEINWVTGWAYCTSHDNCTSDYFCSLSEDETSQCTGDYTPTLEILGDNTNFAESSVTFFIDFTHEDSTVLGSTIWGELYNASVGGTLLQNVTANYDTKYYLTFENLTEYSGYYLKAYGLNQPIYSLVQDNKEFDVVIASIEILYPISTEKVYARTIFPRFILTISDFENVGTCAYHTPQQQSGTFTVSNNVTFNSVPMNPINSWNRLTVECDIGGLTLRKTVAFDSLVVPDQYLLGINLNSHIASTLMLYRIKEMLWIIGFPYFLFILLVSIISLLVYLFKKGVSQLI